MKLIHLKTGILLFLLAISAKTLNGQTVLERISVAERSDGLGYVTRLHLSTPVDSFTFAHTDLNYIQVKISGSNLEYDNYRQPESEIINKILINNIDQETVGIEIYLDPSYLFVTNLYPDVNETDLLLSLTFADEETVLAAISGNSHLFEPARQANLKVDDDYEEETAVHFDSEETDKAEDEPVQEQSENNTVNSFLDHSHPNSLNRTPADSRFNVYSRGVQLLDENRATDTSFLFRSHTPGEQLSVHPWVNRGHTNTSELQVGGRPLLYRLYDAEYFLSNNSEIPMGQNDGALWQGRGSNYFVVAGAGIQYGPFSTVLRPVYVYSENRAFPFEDFDISVHPRFGGNEFQTYLTHADIPLRYGNSSYSRFDLGDSYLQFDYRKFAAGLSNQRLWTGPAIHNPLIFSNHAPGFAHLYVTTRQPYDTLIGSFEGKWLWGRLQESDYFDNDPSNDRRFLTSLSVHYSPSFSEGLHIGFTRASYSNYGSAGVSDMFQVFRLAQPKGVDNPDEAYVTMMSFYARWVFPAAGMEVYTEWGRNDDRRALRDLLAEPELNRGYVLGLLKNFEIASRRHFHLNIEITNLENSSVTATNREFDIWYTDTAIGQGFTNRGQVLGAGIGPGSSTQIVQLTYYDTWGMIGLSGQRIAHYMDRQFKYEDYFRSFARWPQYYFLLDRHEIEMRYGVEALIFLPFNTEIQAGYIVGKTENRYNTRLSDITNQQFNITLRVKLNNYLR